jgi:serine/threonine-protein kinase
MSPEQAMGERDIGARSDVYALGATTYEMLTGEPPFTGLNSQAIVAKVLTDQPPMLRPKRPTVSPAVEHAVLTALQKLPADRFGSAKDFADALDGKGNYASTALMGSTRLTRPTRLTRLFPRTAPCGSARPTPRAPRAGSRS